MSVSGCKYLVGAVCLFCCFLTGIAQPLKKQLYSPFRTKGASPAWESSEWGRTTCVIADTTGNGSENRMFVYSNWDNNYLYYFFKVTDSDLRAYQTKTDDSKLFLDDMVELLMDTRNEKDSCWSAGDIVYHVNILGVKKDDRGSAACITNPAWNGKATATVRLVGSLNDTTDVDQGYLLSLRFPWSEIGQKPRRGLTMGVNFANGDNDGKGRRLFDWVAAWPMRSPYAFGELILK